jgi:fucose permease
MLDPKNTRLLTAGVFFAFFVFGFSDNLKGPVLPALLDDLRLNYALGGAILMSLYIGFMIASLSTGLLADTIGLKVVLVLAGISLALGVAGFTFFTLAPILAVSMAILGFGLGSIELGGNALTVILHAEDKGRYLNLMAVTHGLGSMAAPYYAGRMLAAGYSWRVIYRWDLVLVAVFIACFSTASIPKRENTGKDNLDFWHIGKVAFSPALLVYYFINLVYVATELGLASWMVEYLQKIVGHDVGRSTQSLSVFFGLVMVGRFIGSFVVEKAGYLLCILLASAFACICLAISLYDPARYWWLLPASGFFLSIIFPTIIASVSSTYKEHANSILGLLFFFAGFGGIIGPWLVGIASDLGGIQFGFSLTLVFCLLTSASTLLLVRLEQRAKKLPSKD